MRRLNLKAFHVPIVAACRKTAFGGILLLLGCVSVYSSSGTAICIGLQVGHKCSEPDNGTALLNAICQPPGHAFKQIVQVC